jgi:hypothetical protein
MSWCDGCTLTLRCDRVLAGEDIDVNADSADTIGIGGIAIIGGNPGDPSAAGRTHPPRHIGS